MVRYRRTKMAPTKGESVDDSSLEIESVATRRGRRSKKETGASAALKKIKQSRESGEKVKYEVDEIDNVYDEVDEDEYTKVVRKRQLQDDWIVDDDGTTGYTDDGREIFDEDLDEKPASGAPKRGQKKKINVKKPTAQPKTIKSMFLMGSKSTKSDQNKNVNIEDDELLNGILQDMNVPKPVIKTPAKGPIRQGGRTPKSAGPRKAMPRRLQPPAAPSYYNEAYSEPVLRASKISTPPPLVSKAAKERKAITPQSSNVFKQEVKIEMKDEEESMETACFNGDDGVMDYAEDTHENNENIEEDVKPNVDGDNGLDVMGDFAVDDFDTEDMEALDAVEEKALKTEKKEENTQSKNRGASDLTKAKIQFDSIQPGEAFETIRGQMHANPNEEFKEISVDSSSLNLTTNEEGEKLFKMYWFDAYEDSYAQPGTVFVFGKVWVDSAKSYVSCCVIVKNIERTLFFLPRDKKLAPDGTEIDETVGFTDVYQEFNDDIADRYKIMKFSARRTTKRYAFEVEGIPEDSEYLEVKYSANCPRLPSDMVGKTFSHVFGTSTSSLERLLLQRKLKGPGWLEVKMPQIPNQPMSWCKLEAIVSKPDHITPLTEGNLDPPPLVVLSVSVRTMLNPKTHLHEVLAVTGLVHQDFRVDKVAPKDKYFQNYFCAVTKPHDYMFPYDFKNILKKQDMNVEVCGTERALLGFVVARLQKLDPDVLVGHDISTFDLDVLLHRINACKIPNWSRMGRLRRQVMPKLSFGSKGGFAERTATCGRLVCDVKVSSQELIRCKSYDLTEEKKDRIANLMKQIRAKEKNSPKDEQKTSTTRKKSKQSRSKMGKTRNINYGWLHRTSSDNAYKQLKRLEGASVRTVPYDEEETYFTLDFLKNEACRLFFPEDFEIEIGSFSQEPILAFVDTRGNPCSYLEYLRDRGLYPSKSYIYLMTTARGDKNTGTRDNISSEPKATKQHTDMDDENESEADATNSKHVARRLQNSESNEAECEIKDPVKKDDLVKDGNIYGVCIDGIDVTPSKNQITIEYEELTEFSYSEVTIRSLANSLEQCYWDKSLSDPFIRDEGFDNFCPLEHGFTVTAIHKADTCYLERVFSPSCESFEESTSRFFYPCRDNSSNDIIIHHPLEIWGYDENRLMLGVVTSFMDNPEVEYVWYNGGDIARQGHNLCCIPVNEPGIYKVEVRVDGKAEMSKPIKVELLKNLEDPPTDEKKKNAEPEASIKSPHFLPFVDKNQVTFTNEIGRGSYGVVFKGVWSGTDVAIKDIKVRNAKRLKSVMETEVQVHTMVRHPNITQIMAVSMEKNHLYIVSEFVNGANLEELLFGEDVEVKENISEKKIFIAKQVTQAAAYLHNLSPPIVHRDIKPANIVVAKDSYVTKLCDMGLSKLKSATMQAVTATGVPGTPHYMAPECILRKKKSDLNSDV